MLSAAEASLREHPANEPGPDGQLRKRSEGEAMKREDAGLVGVVFIFVIIAVVLNSLGVLLDSAFAVASLAVIAVAMGLFVYWYVRYGR